MDMMRLDMRKMSADDVIASASAKGVLSDAQKAEIRKATAAQL